MVKRGRLLGICIKIFSDVFLIQELFKKIFFKEKKKKKKTSLWLLYFSLQKDNPPKSYFHKKKF